MHTRWSMIRQNSPRIVRTAIARGGGVTPSICSTARA